MTIERYLALAGLLLAVFGFFGSMAGVILHLMEFKELSRKMLPWTVCTSMLAIACSTASFILRI